MFAAEFEPVETHARRSHRTTVAIDAGLIEDKSHRTLCKVTDISIHGARLQTYSAPRRGSTIWLNLPACGEVEAEVMWADDYAAGCQFHPPLDPIAFEEIVRMNG